MESPRRKLPIGIETFSEIISEGHYYVDKTGFAQRLIENGKYYFLSRPRRFGKSLFLDTLNELFAGNQSLFGGLHIYDKWDWSRRFPVVRISFGAGVLQTRAELDEQIRELLANNQKRLGVSCSHNSIAGQFSQLIELAHEKYGERTVVLIDEYDKPILDNIADSEVALAMREGLKNLYSVIKTADAHIRFAFLTGVSKFSKVSLFSGLNNLQDITLDPAYSALCGYTDQDVDTVFMPELPGLDRDEIRRWYNGYSWLGESIYNPFDLLLLFQRRQFESWWFETATPAFLIKLLAERQAWLPALGEAQADAELLSAFDVDNISTTALMFQAGYLTIDQTRRVEGSTYYQLRLPNHEVQKSLYSSLLRVWSANPERELQNKMALPGLLRSANFDGLKNLFQAFFAGIPHQWYTKNPIARFEGYYASVFYAYFAAAGLQVYAEDSTSFGRIDLAVIMAERIFLLEFKVVELSGKGGALAQLQSRGYADKYRALGLPIHLLGVEFSRKSRNLLNLDVALA